MKNQVQLITCANRIYRPRPDMPFTFVTLKDGTRRITWTTFTRKQIDIDVNPQARAIQFFATGVAAGV